MHDLTTDLDRLLTLYPTQAVYIGGHRLRKVSGQFIVAKRGPALDNAFLMTWIPVAIFTKLATAVRYIVLEEVKAHEEEIHERVEQRPLRERLGLTFSEALNG
jgi:hypothetical protein